MRLVLAIALVVLGCSSHGQPAIDPGAPAGDVTEVDGDVHATCDGKTRALAVGDVVAGDDVIATGADGRVTIVLRRNHVPWSLGPGLSKRVADSAAWTAAAAASGEVVTDDHAAAAGRHAERSATDTGASAPTEAPPPKTKSVEPDQPGQADQIGLGNLGTIGHGAGGGEGQGYGAGRGSLGGDRAARVPKVDASVTVTGGVAREIAQRIVRQNLGRMRLCYEQGLTFNAALAGKVVVKAAVGADGAVVSATIASSTAGDSMDGCLVHAAQALAFPSSAKPWLVTIALTLSTGG